jgi:hypothetical protein
MYACDICGKEFTTKQALGGHRAYCGKLVRVGSEGGSEGSEGSNLRLFSEGSEGMTLTKPSLKKRNLLLPRVLAEAESVALRSDKTGYVSRPRSRANSSALQNIQWGKAFASVAIGIFVIWLVYKSLESWEWKGAGKKQVSPYKLIGGLITGLG